MIVSFVHTKGGVGKTTSAMMLAHVAAQKGTKTIVYDADPQGSASRWSDIAHQRGDDLPFAVYPATAQKLRSLVSDPEIFCIIDTPPGKAKEIQAAIDIADLVIIPSGPNPIDIDRVWPTLETTENRPTGVLLTGVLKHTRLYHETREIFEEQNVPTFYNAVPRREDIKAAFGTRCKNLHGYEEIYQEIIEI